MKIAVLYDYPFRVNVKREGIGVFTRFLLNSIMANYSDVEIEFWCYDFNRENVKSSFQDIFEKYPNRVTIFDNFSNWDYVPNALVQLCKYYQLIAFNIIDFIDRIKFKIKKKDKYIHKRKFVQEKIKKLKDKNFHRIIGKENYNDVLQQTLIKNVKKYSKANVVFSIFVNLELGRFFNCPKFVQVHDLFTLPLFDLFKDDIENLADENKQVLNNLGEYALKGATFISSSMYVAQNHSLKYIPHITNNQISVIPFPPLIKDFNQSELLNKEDFKAKYNIASVYIVYPSQNRPNKNWIVILKAIKALRDEGMELQFVTTGRIDDVKITKEYVDKNNLRNLICEVGNLSEDELYALYKYADLQISSTIMEGMGISGQALEALKVGNIPVIHAKSLGIEDSLKSVGLNLETADLNWFDIDDDKKLVYLIKDVLSNKQLHINKQKHVLEAYQKRTWDDVAKEYYKLFCIK